MGQTEHHQLWVRRRIVAMVSWKVTVVAPVQKESSLDITGMSFFSGDKKQRKNTVGMGERETDALVTSCTTPQDSWTEPACRAECSSPDTILVFDLISAFGHSHKPSTLCRSDDQACQTQSYQISSLGHQKLHKKHPGAAAVRTLPDPHQWVLSQFSSLDFGVNREGGAQGRN